MRIYQKMNVSKVKYSEIKIVRSHSDLQLGTTREDDSAELKAKTINVNSIKIIGNRNVRKLL